jgi:hypothetical protein
MILQLNPPLPVSCPKGQGLCHFLIDYSMESHLYWVIVLDESGEIWTYANPYVRFQKNISLDRYIIPNIKDIKNGQDNRKIPESKL